MREPTRINTPYFDFFPKIKYDINRNQFPVQETVTDIFYRLGMIRNTVAQTSSYYVYDIEDGDTPEILAGKFYDDAGAGWIILYANYIIDPQWEWPLTDEQFNKYIIGKYGSIENAATKVHHFEKVIERYNSSTDTTTIDRYVINAERLTGNIIDIPFNYFYPYAISSESTVDSTDVRVDTVNNLINIDFDFGDKTGSLPDTQSIVTINMGDHTVIEKTYKTVVYSYDYEMNLNDAKRSIKIIKKDFYNTIMNEFKIFASNQGQGAAPSVESYLRRLF